MNAALQESVKGKWNGDIDLGDGKLKVLRKEYDQRRSYCSTQSIKESRLWLENHLRNQLDNLEGDIKFLTEGLILAEREYCKKLNSPTTSAETLKNLCWERVEFSTLLTQAQSIIEKLETLLSKLHPASPSVKNVTMAYKTILKEMNVYLRNLFVKKRQLAATHVLLFLVSDERRNKKPFAMPVQYIPYKSIKDQYLRDMTNTIKQEMVKMGLKPVGKYPV